MNYKSKCSKVYLIVTIDTECDHGPDWARSLPLTFDSINKGLPERLQPAFESIGVIPTYLLTVEVMEDQESVQSLRNLNGNHEFGTHLHAAFIEPEKKFHDYAGIDSPDFQCSYAPEVEYKKLENLTKLFVDNFGYQPASFRAGRFGACANTIESLQKLGYLVDTSVTPHILWEEPNGQVDYRRAPEQPYFPASGKLIEADSQTSKGLLEIPVTVKKRFLRGPQWFRPWFSSIGKMKKVVRYHLNKYRDNHVIVINMMFHSMEVIPKASPYPQTLNEVSGFIDDMQNVLNWCKGEGIEFSSTKDFYHAFKKNN